MLQVAGCRLQADHRPFRQLATFNLGLALLLVIFRERGMLLFVKGNWHKALPYLFMLVAALSRWPGLFPSNFSAFYGLAFCAGAFFPRQIKWWLPLGTMLATDFLLNAFYYHEPLLNGYMLVKTLCFAGIVALGCSFSPRRSWLALVGGGLLGAVLFYLITK